MSFQFPDFFDPNDPFPIWALVIAIGVLMLAAMLPAPERGARSAGVHWQPPIAVSNPAAL